MPAAFKGEHDDIDQFLEDCTTYFKVYRHYFQKIHSLMVVFATSHFKGAAQDWWVHHREGYWSNDPDDPEPSQYWYSHWDDFTREFKARF